MKIVLMAVIVFVKPKSISESHFFTSVGLEDRFFENLIILCYLIIWIIRLRRRKMIGKFKQVVFLMVILATILAAVTCAVNPVSGKKELMFFSEKAEITLGQNSDREIKQTYGIYQDKGMNDYVNGVGQKLAAYSFRPKLQFHFAVLDTPVINAFAAPGGFIYVTRGIMALMNSEAELAVVLGHEIGHVDARHSVKRLSGTLLISIGLLLGSALSEDIAKVAGLAGIGTQLLFLKFSRSDEYQADSLGIQCARKAAYSPVEMVQFFSSLENMSADSGAHRLPSFLSTHPLTKNRIAKVKELLSSQDVRLAIKKDDYLHQIDGLIYGDNPQQGFVEGGAFYQPEMAFYFRQPADWALENTPKQVVMTAKDGKAALVLQAENSELDLEEYARAKAKELGQAEILEENSRPVNSFSSRHAWYKVPQENKEPLLVRLTCIRKGGMIYSFSALSVYRDFNTYRDVFEKSIDSFQNLNDPRYLNRRPNRLTLVRADGNQTLQGIFNQASVDRKMWKQLGVFNSISLESVPANRQLIKLVK
jgi:predicted Zn-dependent protease